MRDLTPLARIVREALSSEDMVGLVTAMLCSLPPHLARLCIVHRIAATDDPKHAAIRLIDELTLHFVSKE